MLFLIFIPFILVIIALKRLLLNVKEKKSLSLLDLIDYQPKFDSDYLNSLIKKAKKSWNNINPDEWLLRLRGGYEA